MKTKLFITPEVPGSQTIFLVGLHKGTLDIGQTLFTNVLPKTFSLTAHEFVDSLEEADFALFPHAPKSKSDPLLLEVEKAKTLAKSAGKQLIVFVGGDMSHDIYVDDAIVLKGSQYKRLRRENEIIAVPSCEDFGDTLTIAPRNKSERPSVSFCGWAGFPSNVAYAKYLIRNALIQLDASLTFRPILVVHKKGLYWRRRSLSALEHDTRIDTHFIVRSSFSANTKTISLDPAQARKEYVDNMYESDFVLCPKGDGNFSVRFYETLSMGRIPILIDTDVVLPFEDRINYDSFVLRVSYKDVDALGTLVHDFYHSLSNEEFIAMQQRARSAFETTLRIDRYFDTLFSSVLPSLFSSK